MLGAAPFPINPLHLAGASKKLQKGPGEATPFLTTGGTMLPAVSAVLRGRGIQVLFYFNVPGNIHDG